MTESFTILHQIERNGWLTAPLQGGWQLSRPQTDEVIFMSITPKWLCLSMPLEEVYNATLPTGLADHVSFYHHLLEQNERMFMIKLGLDDTLPVLMVEVGVKAISALMINRALGALSHYAKGKPLAQNKQQEQLVRVVKTGIATLQESDKTPGISKEVIRRYIQNLAGAGWGIKEDTQGLTWHLGYKGMLRVFDAYLTVTKMWAYFQVPILADRTAPVLSAGNLQEQALFLEYLLKLNATWFMAKIGISEEDQVLLLVEVPVETLDFPLLQLLTRTIGTYLDRYGQEIQIMAWLQNDPRLSELLLMAVS